VPSERWLTSKSSRLAYLPCNVYFLLSTNCFECVVFSVHGIFYHGIASIECFLFEPVPELALVEDELSRACCRAKALKVKKI